jgi:hypothetical protein
VFGESGPVLVMRAVFATVDWLQFWELAKSLARGQNTQ